MTESDLPALRARAENGDDEALDELIELATEQGDMNELRRLADGGNSGAADQLIELATERGDMDELRRLADRGNATATDQLITGTVLHCQHSNYASVGVTVASMTRWLTGKS
ncbi:hypothetical protein [Amycolatopsis coloradensis]|uniref:hypothetical protein n=1 Tax=Amycolatopsis coloradensis TaxID=76021 RepID=UPI001FC9E483|nr:hypothetical protein [Amycolatopsis coloradensis]